MDSVGQFADTAELNNFIRDTIRDRRPDKLTASQLQKALLGTTLFLKPGIDSSGTIMTTATSFISNNEVIGPGTVTVVNGSSSVTGTGTNFTDATVGTGIAYWGSFTIEDSSGTVYELFGTPNTATTFTIGKVISLAQKITTYGVPPSTFPGVSGTYVYKVVTNEAAGLFAIALGNRSYAQNYGISLGGYVAATGEASFAFGNSVIASGNRAFAGGWGTTGGDGADRRVRASGQTSFNFSQNATGQTAGHGALATASAILGGTSHNIPVGATGSAIIGGNTIKASVVTNTVHMPRVRIGLGTSGALVTDNTETNFAMVESTTGEIQLRTLASLGIPAGITGLTATRIPIAASATTLTDNASLTFASGILTTSRILIDSLGSGTRLQLGASNTTGTQLLFRPSPVLPSTPLNGGFEYASNSLRFTTSNIRHWVPLMVGGAVVLDFDSTGPGASATLVRTFTGQGVNVGDAVFLSIPAAALASNGVFTAWVSNVDEVTIRYSNLSSTTGINLASGTFTVYVVSGF